MKDGGERTGARSSRRKAPWRAKYRRAQRIDAGARERGIRAARGLNGGRGEVPAEGDEETGDSARGQRVLCRGRARVRALHFVESCGASRNLPLPGYLSA